MSIAFGDFVLDPEERRLLRGGEAIQLNGRYLDALILLAREPDRLVTKDRFMSEVWRGIPVTDEALTQCIKELRRTLGDDASRPRFIETVPGHGYRFIAEVVGRADAPAPGASPPRPLRGWQRTVVVALAGTLGAGLAGLAGGIFYGFLAASGPLDQGIGATSVVLVLTCLCILVALIGGAGVSFGVAFGGATAGRGRWWARALGGATGGLLVGAMAKLLGLDLFRLLVGASPGDITGPLEGVILGGAIGFGSWLASQSSSRRRGILLAGLCGGSAGMLIGALGRPMMAGSLALVAGQFPGSRLDLDRFGSLASGSGLGSLAVMISCALEGLLFAAGIVAAMQLAENHLGEDRQAGVRKR